MAEEIIGLKLELDTSGASVPMASLKTQIKEATNELVNFTEKFGATSKEAINAAKRVAELKDRMGDARQMVDAFNPDAKFNALTQALQGAAGGFEAIQGAMGILGIKSADTEKALLKVQSAMAFSQGLSSFLDGGIEGFRNLYRVISGSVIQAFTALKAAIGSTGIGLLVVALAAVAANWDKIKSAMSGISAEQKKINETSAKNLEVEKDKLKKIGDQDNVLKLQGKSEQQILDLKIKQTDSVIKASKAQLESMKITNEAAYQAAVNNNKILKGVIDIVAMPIVKLLEGIDAIGSAFGKEFNLASGFKNLAADFFFNPEEIKASNKAAEDALLESIANLENTKAGYMLSKSSGAKDAVKGTKKEKVSSAFDANGGSDDELEAIKQRNETELAFLEDKEAKKQAIIDEAEKQRAINLTESIREEQAKRTAQAKHELEVAKLVADSKKEIQQSEFDAIEGGINLIASLFGKSKAVQAGALIADSAVGIAKIIINTQAANSAAVLKYSAIPGGQAISATEIALNKINAGIGIAANVAATAKGLSALGGGNASGASVGGGAPNAPSATVFNTTTKLNKDSIDKINDKALKAYVVETDINNGQKRIERILINTKFK